MVPVAVNGKLTHPCSFEDGKLCKYSGLDSTVEVPNCGTNDDTPTKAPTEMPDDTPTKAPTEMPSDATKQRIAVAALAVGAIHLLFQI